MARWFNTDKPEMWTDKNRRNERKAENLSNWGVKRYFSVGKIYVAKTDKMSGRIFISSVPQPVQLVVSVSLGNWKIFMWLF